jgi:hypothetical protein
MAFDNTVSPIDEENEAELAHADWLDDAARIPRPLRLLLRREDLYSVRHLIAETTQQAAHLAAAIDAARSLRSCDPRPIYRSVEELVADRVRLAEALESQGGRRASELACCWRMLAATTSTPAQCRHHIGQAVVGLFGAYSSGSQIGEIGLEMAADLALAVAAWSLACHGGGISGGGHIPGPWLLLQVPVTGNLLRDAAEWHPKSTLQQANADLRARIESLQDEIASRPVDNSKPERGNKKTALAQKALGSQRTLH